MIPGQRRTMGRYQIDDVLGVSGLTTVYRARDVALDREVALKVLHPHLARDAHVRERFVHESRALARVRHPHLAQVFDAGEADDAAYRAMELVHGQTLAQILSERGPLPLFEVVIVAADVAAALSALHTRGLIHRDIKPSNIMVEHNRSPDGQGLGRTVLLDLGGIGVLDSSSIARSSALVGTPEFMAPEEVEPGGRPSAQTDVYQLAATIFTLLAGQPPFTGDIAETTHAVVHRPPPDLRAYRPDVQPATAEVVARALAKAASHRPNGPLAFSAQLRAALSATRAPAGATPNPAPPLPTSPPIDERAPSAPLVQTMKPPAPFATDDARSMSREQAAEPFVLVQDAAPDGGHTAPAHDATGSAAAHAGDAADTAASRERGRAMDIPSELPSSVVNYETAGTAPERRAGAAIPVAAPPTMVRAPARRVGRRTRESLPARGGALLPFGIAVLAMLIGAAGGVATICTPAPGSSDLNGRETPATIQAESSPFITAIPSPAATVAIPSRTPSSTPTRQATSPVTVATPSPSPTPAR